MIIVVPVISHHQIRFAKPGLQSLGLELNLLTARVPYFHSASARVDTAAGKDDGFAFHGDGPYGGEADARIGKLKDQWVSPW